MQLVLNESGYPREDLEIAACDEACRALTVPFNPGMGFVDPVTVAAAVQITQTLLGTANQKDKARLQANADAFKMAAAGDQLAIEYLRYRSGRFGQYDAPADSEFAKRYGTPIGGWATDVAKNDAFRLYNQALAIWGISPEEAGGSGGQANPSSMPYYGTTTLPKVTTTAAMSFLPLVALGAAMLFFGSRRGGR